MVYLRIIRAFSKILRIHQGLWWRPELIHGQRLTASEAEKQEEEGKVGGRRWCLSSCFCVLGAFAYNFSYDFCDSLRYVSLFSIHS